MRILVTSNPVLLGKPRKTGLYIFRRFSLQIYRHFACVIQSVSVFPAAGICVLSGASCAYFRQAIRVSAYRARQTDWQAFVVMYQDLPLALARLTGYAMRIECPLRDGQEANPEFPKNEPASLVLLVFLT